MSNHQGFLDWVGDLFVPIHRDGHKFLGIALLATGFPGQIYLGLPMPMPLAAAGAPGCMMLVAPHDVRFARTDAAGRAAFVTNIPSAPALRGTEFQQQRFVVDADANALGMVATHGATGRIGD